ncbi:molybdenum cofactor guanylyltransferase MobA [Castellaniella caeni]|uniref:molybdenum cofactor guanylyltransferase MobA n=1 Tax=Castellaniella caeni TaxID=266123 RepID=UPI00082CC2BE|nr:molybdenum cofactor guanylyltransferase MobA [Castellaniella caeni]
MVIPADLDGLILAGGQSQRMRTPQSPQADKGLRVWQGQPLVAQVQQYMRAQGVARFLISANRHVDLYAQYGQVVPDAAELQGSGPLAGLLAGLQQARAPWLFVLPVDVVRWPANLLARLAAQATARQPAYARTPDGPHPLCLLVHRDCAAGLQAWVRAGERRVQGWLRSCEAQAVYFDEADCLVNLNTPEDWQRWQPG